MPPEGEFLAADLHGNQWFLADGAGETQFTYELSSVDPVCRGEQYQPYCLLFQAKYRKAFDEQPEVVFTWSPLDSSDESGSERGDLDGHYAGVNPESGAIRWQVDYLDFSQSSNPSGCPVDPDNPCVPADSLSDGEYQRCRLHMPHDVEVVSESASELRMWWADTGNNRMLDVSVRSDSNCAVVHDVIDETNPDWDIYSSNNSVMYRVEQDGTETLLMSAKGSRENSTAGEAQLSGSGKGKVFLWENRGVGWAQRWEFPPQADGVESYVSNPHGANFVTDAEGHELVVYAHSLGLHDEWTGNSGVGSVGVLLVEGGTPAYVADIRIAGQGALHFPRDLTVVDDRRWLVTDSGCVGGICTRASQSWLIAPITPVPSTKSGVFTVGHENLEILDARVIGDPLFTTSNQLYSVEWIAE